MTCLKFLIPVCFFMLATTAQAGLQETIAYIEQLLHQGKTVALLLVDMQTGFMRSFEASEFSRVVEYQAALLDHFAKNINVHFIDVNYETQGPTISYLLNKLKINQHYRLLMKNDNSAFRKSVIIPEPGEEESGEYICKQLIAYLHSQDIEHLVITGCFDASCIYQTARDGAARGYHVFVDREINAFTRTTSSRYLAGESAEHAAARKAQRWIALKNRYPEKLTVVESVVQSTCEAAKP